MNGDIRVAFDIMKSSFIALFNLVKYGQTIAGSEETKEALQSDDQIKVTLGLVVKVFNDKYGSKLRETMRRLPRQSLIVLDAIIGIYAGFPSGNEDKRVGYVEL
jgi:hypothetical protein